MIYYKEKEPLIIPNYGRNVQMLVQHINDEIKDKKERTVAIDTLVRQIAQQNPNMKNQPEYLQKIWGHLFIISDYKLDIDSPYPLPERPKEQILKPKRIEYSKGKHKYSFYGKNVELMIEKAITMEESEVKKSFIDSIATYMKLAYKLWNDDKVADETIIKHLEDLSDGKIKLEKLPESAKFENGFTNREYRRPKSRNNNKRHYKK
jgi:hypothetical protein